MSDFSVKIRDMKSMPWPMALVVSTALLVIGVLAGLDKDIDSVVSAFLLLLGALGYAELREIKTQTNGNTASKDLELAATRRAAEEERALARRAQEELINRLLGSPPIGVPSIEAAPQLKPIEAAPPSDGSSPDAHD